MKSKITICPNCGEPMIWTLGFIKALNEQLTKHGRKLKEHFDRE